MISRLETSARFLHVGILFAPITLPFRLFYITCKKKGKEGPWTRVVERCTGCAQGTSRKVGGDAKG